MSNSGHPKSDNNSSNVEKMRNIVRNTEENLHEAEISLEFADPQQFEEISEQNKRRKQSIEVLKEEMKDVIATHKKGKS